jgi:hypothetical protein
MQADEAPTYLEIATDLIKRWMVYLPLDAVLAIPDRPGNGYPLGDCKHHEEGNIYRFSPTARYPLAGLEISRTLVEETILFAWDKHSDFERCATISKVVHGLVFVTEDFSRPLTPVDLDSLL